MARYCIGRTGVVRNVVEAPDKASASSDPLDDVFVDPTGSTNVGASYDVKDVSYDKLDIVTHTILFQIIKGTIALPQPTLTVAQYKALVKSKM
jgi:hypothetical protein